MILTFTLSSLDEVRAFFAGSAPVALVAPKGEARYRWLAATLRQFD